ncbi:phage tail tape measure protein [Cupriavidus pauculus]|uniref:phage tail tape measure protein n=1 Tax=Cupriavidus pauculus TaxID=82633 RepID=UPI0038574C8E
MSQVVGKATLQADADVSGLKAGFADAKRSVQDLKQAAAETSQSTSRSARSMAEAARDASDRMKAANDRFVTSLEKTANTFGMSKSAALEYSARMRGIPQEVYEPLIAKIRETEQAQARLAATTERTQARVGVSAAQTAAAMRQVPAQFTDIVTQLAGGQSPLLVLTQQGGQLKDMFGGIGPAARALGGYVAGLVNPLTLAAGAAALFGVALYKGEQETVNFNRSLVLTGNYAGQTAASFERSVEVIADSTQRGFGPAREALMALVSSGRLSGEALTVLGEDTVRMAALTGKSLADIAADYAKMPDGVAKWAEEHNKSLHYITFAQYEYIKSLEDQGRVQEAVLENARILHEHLATKGVQTVGYLERAWNGLANAIGKAWDAAKSFGRETPDDGSAAITGRQNELLRRAGAARGRGDVDTAKRLEQEANQLASSVQSLAVEQNRLAEATARYKREQEAAISASGKLDSIDERVNKQKALNKALEENKRLEEAIRKVNPNDERVSASAIAAREAETRRRYRDTTGIAAGQNVLGGELEALRAQGRQRELQLKQELSTLEKLRAADFFSQEDYIHRSYEARRAALEDQVRLAEREANVAGGRQSLAERERYASRVKELRAEIAGTYAEEAADVEKYQERIRGAVAQTALQISNYNGTRAVQAQRQINALGLGDNAKQLADTLNQIEDQFRRFRDQFTERVRQAGGANALETDDYRRQIESINQAMADAMERARDDQQRLFAAQGDWTNGATRALQNYADGAKDIAGQVSQAFGNTFKGLEDAVVTFVTTGKLSFSSFAQSVIADIARIQLRSSLSGLFQAGASLLGGFLGGGAAATSFNGASPVAGSFGGPTTTGIFYSDGGYTGDGGKFQPAGIVHRGEYVIDAETTARPGVRQLLDALTGRDVVKGYADGGYVGTSPATRLLRGSASEPAGGAGDSSGGPGSLKIELVNQGSQQMQAKSATPRFDVNGTIVTVVIDDLQNGGPIRSAIQNLPRQ